MKKLNFNLKVLSHGISTLISDALCVISIVARDQVQKGSITTPTLTKSGYVNSDGVPLTTNDKALNHAFILDTEGDVLTKMLISCQTCGSALEVLTVRELPEVAVEMLVGPCSMCTDDAHQAGYHQRSKEDYTRGF